MSQVLDAAPGTIQSAPAKDPLSRARRLAPLIDSLAGDTETEGTMPARLVEAFRETELFWLLLPGELGGLGADLITAIETLEEVSRADGSTGWSLMANVTGTALAGAFVGDRAAQAMFGGARRAITAGMLGPGGKAVATEGGLRGAGDYAFGSGCAHADWFGAGMLVMENGKPRCLPSGLPEVRVCFVPRAQVEVLGNWDVMGLQGTGSYDYRVPEQFIANDFIMERTELVPRRGGRLFTLGIAGLACLGHAAVALGLMKRSLQEIARIAQTKKRPGYPTVAGEHPIFLREFAIREAAAQSTRAFVINVFADAQATVLSGGTLSAVQRARFRQCTTYLHEVAAEVVRFCYQWGGSSAQRMASPLGRCMRDMGVATQHVFVDPVSLADAGIPLLAHWNAR
jgi:alkylation response protein AidB-like acyl-CoA dehydrogenase